MWRGRLPTSINESQECLSHSNHYKHLTISSNPSDVSKWMKIHVVFWTPLKFPLISSSASCRYIDYLTLRDHISYIMFPCAKPLTFFKKKSVLKKHPVMFLGSPNRRSISIKALKTDENKKHRKLTWQWNWNTDPAIKMYIFPIQKWWCSIAMLSFFRGESGRFCFGIGSRFCWFVFSVGSCVRSLYIECILAHLLKKVHMGSLKKITFQIPLNNLH